MKTSCSHPFPIALLTIAAFVSPVAGRADEKPAMPEPKGENPAEKKLSGNDLLRTAVTTMSNLKGYHAGGTFGAGDHTATISGEFGTGTADMHVPGFDGKIAFRRAVKDPFFISHDSGKSWQEDSSKDMTSLLSLAVTSLAGTEDRLWELGEFKVIGGEKLEEEEVLHLQKPAQGDKPATDFWLAKDATPRLVIRRASFVISAYDGDFPVAMAYTDLNKPLEIAAPVTGDKRDNKEKPHPALR